MGYLHCSCPGCTCSGYTSSAVPQICANCGHSYFNHNRAGDSLRLKLTTK